MNIKLLSISLALVSDSNSTKFGRRHSVKQSLTCAPRLLRRLVCRRAMFLSSYLHSEALEPVSLDHFVLARPFTTIPCCTASLAASEYRLLICLRRNVALDA